MDIEKFFQKALTAQKDDNNELAITLYKQVLQEDEFHLPTLFNLATIYGEEHNYEEAIYYYERMLEQEPDFVRAYYNLAVCYLQIRNVEQAQHLLEQAVRLVPEYATAQHLLGSILFKKRDFFKASDHLQLTIKHDPESAEAFCHLGMLRLQQEDLESAQVYLEQAIKLQPAQAEAHYHMGLIHLKRGDEEQAEESFEGTIDRDENHFAALYNMSLIKKKQGYSKLADEFLRRAETLEPDNEHIKFLRATLDNDNNPEHAPKTFVTELFDRYARYYDEQMQQGLHYQVPEGLFKVFTNNTDSAHHSLNIVELGCGTGLTGQLFKLYAKHFTGIDLSEPMLAKAKEKHIYDELVHADVLSTVQDLDGKSVDLFIAADVLGYIGKLDELFAAMAQKLKHGGKILFSIEAHAGTEDYVLTEHTRFAHRPEYIQNLAEKLQLQIATQENATLREQDGEQVSGCYFLLHKYIARPG
jgi:predicted TPR repeat methyltransferase